MKSSSNRQRHAHGEGAYGGRGGIWRKLPWWGGRPWVGLLRGRGMLAFMANLVPVTLIVGEEEFLVDRALREADLFVAIGTSGAVYPAAGFVAEARAYGLRTCEIKP